MMIEEEYIKIVDFITTPPPPERGFLGCGALALKNKKGKCLISLKILFSTA